jgi:hypothetical protein
MNVMIDLRIIALPHGILENKGSNSTSPRVKEAQVWSMPSCPGDPESVLSIVLTSYDPVIKTKGML